MRNAKCEEEEIRDITNKFDLKRSAKFLFAC